MKNFRVIRVKTLPVTNTKGLRVKLIEDRCGIKDTVIISYDYKFDNFKDLAIDYLKNLGINVVGFGSIGDEYVLFSDSWGVDFKPLK